MRALALLLIALPAICLGASGLKTGEFSPPAMAPDFSLPGTHGKTLKLSDYRGKVVALGFGFTSCHEVCPTTLAELASIRKQLGAASADFQVVYVTVDPAKDTPKVMKAYVTGFDPSFLGATGTATQLEAVRKQYGAFAAKGKPGDGMDHSSFVYLIDRTGKLRGISPYGTPVADVLHDVHVLLGK